MSIKNLLTFAAPRRFAASDGCTFLLKLTETRINSSIKKSMSHSLRCHGHPLEGKRRRRHQRRRRIGGQLALCTKVEGNRSLLRKSGESGRTTSQDARGQDTNR